VSDELSVTLAELVDRFAEAVAERLYVPAEPQGSPWMTIDEVAEYLRWPKTRVQKLTAANAMPCRRHGRRILYRRDELDDWLDGYREGPPAPPSRAPARAPRQGGTGRGRR
jgi:excisionase family DNA binding protein